MPMWEQTHMFVISKLCLKKRLWKFCIYTKVKGKLFVNFTIKVYSKETMAFTQK